MAPPGGHPGLCNSAMGFTSLGREAAPLQEGHAWGDTVLGRNKVPGPQPGARGLSTEPGPQEGPRAMRALEQISKFSLSIKQVINKHSGSFYFCCTHRSPQTSPLNGIWTDGRTAASLTGSPPWRQPGKLRGHPPNPYHLHRPQGRPGTSGNKVQR